MLQNKGISFLQADQHSPRAFSLKNLPVKFCCIPIEIAPEFLESFLGHCK